MPVRPGGRRAAHPGVSLLTLRARLPRPALAAGALAAALALAAPAAAQAAVVQVDHDSAGVAPNCGHEGEPDCHTIGDGVAAASPGDTVRVAPGVYGEKVTVAKPVTLVGAQGPDGTTQGNDARTRSVPRAEESVVNGEGGGFDVSGSGVTIDGFTIEGPPPGDSPVPPPAGPGIYLHNDGSGRQILDNVIRDNVFGLYANSSTESGAVETTVRHNRFEGNSRDGSASGNGIYTDQGFSNLTIDENRFLNDPGTALVAAGTTQTGLKFTGNSTSNDGAVFLTSTSDPLITGNTLTGSQNHGIQLAGGVTGAVIEHNAISGSSWSAVRVSEDFGSNQNVDVTENALVGSGDYGLKVTGAHSGVSAHLNRITGNGLGGAFGSDGPVDAENNWWGCNSDPMVQIPATGDPQPNRSSSGCDSAAGVDADPWLLLTVGASPGHVKTQLQGEPLEKVTLNASLKENSAKAPVTPVSFPDTDVVFSFSRSEGAPTDGASVESPKRTENGVATSELVPPKRPGPLNVTATLDSASHSQPVQIDNRPPLISSLTSSPQNPLAGDRVDFSASASDPENTNLSYGWDFGDGTKTTTGTGNTSHTYDRAGSYTVHLVVRDEDGGELPLDRTISVGSRPNPPPDTTGPAVGVFRDNMVLSRKGSTSVRLLCAEPPGELCTGSAQLVTAKKVRTSRRSKPRKVTLAKKSFAISGSSFKPVSFRLSAANRRLVRRLRRVAVIATGTARDRSGNPTKFSSAQLTLKAAR
jgi:parallel beta-helix repeat protein